MREAVFRYKIDRIASDLRDRQQSVIFFLSIDREADPSDALMTRFGGLKPRVKKVSEAVYKEYEGFFDKETSTKGMLLTVTSIKWIGETAAEVESKQFVAPLEASGHVFQVRFEKGKWVVTADHTEWIS